LVFINGPCRRNWIAQNAIFEKSWDCRSRDRLVAVVTRRPATASIAKKNAAFEVTEVSFLRDIEDRFPRTTSVCLSFPVRWRSRRQGV
jgi:hypothetical protein